MDACRESLCNIKAAEESSANEAFKSTSSVCPGSLSSTFSSSESSEAAAVASTLPYHDGSIKRLLGRRAVAAAAEQDQVRLRLLLVSGNRSDFACPLDWTIHQVKQNVVHNWPVGMSSTFTKRLAVDRVEWKCEEQTNRVECVRILYQGRFLDDAISLKSKSQCDVDSDLNMVP